MSAALLKITCAVPVDGPRAPGMQKFYRNILKTLRVSVPKGLDSRRPLAACATTNRNPYDFTPGDHGLESASFGTDELTKQQQTPEEIEEAKGAALRLLSLRSHSRKELKTKLLERGHALYAVHSALDRLAEVGLQSDGEFAEAFARSKWRQVKWGPSKIRSELNRRGVSVEHSKAALEGVFGPDGLRVRRYLEEEAAEERGQAWTPTASAESALLQATRRQYQLTAGLPGEARKRRLVGWLQRRGHAWEDISKLLQLVEKEESEG